MASEITVTHKGTYLFVHMQGEPLDGEERQSTFENVLKEATEADGDLLIHEDTLSGQPQTVSEYIARANLLATSSFKKRIAFVPPPEFPTHTFELIENVAKNEGMTVKLFSHAKDAIKWIEGE